MIKPLAIQFSWLLQYFTLDISRVIFKEAVIFHGFCSYTLDTGFLIFQSLLHFLGATGVPPMDFVGLQNAGNHRVKHCRVQLHGVMLPKPT